MDRGDEGSSVLETGDSSISRKASDGAEKRLPIASETRQAALGPIAPRSSTINQCFCSTFRLPCWHRQADEVCSSPCQFGTDFDCVCDASIRFDQRDSTPRARFFCTYDGTDQRNARVVHLQITLERRLLTASTIADVHFAVEPRRSRMAVIVIREFVQSLATLGKSFNRKEKHYVVHVDSHGNAVR